MLKKTVLSRNLCMAVIAASLLFVSASTGCNKSGGGDTEAKMRKSLAPNSKFDINKLTPEQLAGYEKAMNEQRKRSQAAG
ncbi:MAG: hypothetical protein V4671_00960, partial [Armatimonadota bacterium]